RIHPSSSSESHRRSAPSFSPQGISPLSAMRSTCRQLHPSRVATCRASSREHDGCMVAASAAVLDGIVEMVTMNPSECQLPTDVKHVRHSESKLERCANCDRSVSTVRAQSCYSYGCF